MMIYEVRDFLYPLVNVDGELITRTSGAFPISSRTWA